MKGGGEKVCVGWEGMKDIQTDRHTAKNDNGGNRGRKLKRDRDDVYD